MKKRTDLKLLKYSKCNTECLIECPNVPHTRFIRSINILLDLPLIHLPSELTPQGYFYQVIALVSATHVAHNLKIKQISI